ncbi:hypothetical protein ACIQ4I_12590 [Rummeliibacillus sp. NPDC094406]|uniref:hypothetical protein n=1 Tax=Rummeliibacillus sp. NPDC094406 TaxID=3364511 RepID=UPI003802D53B
MIRKYLSRHPIMNLLFMIIFFLLFTTSVNALKWAYPFVSWDGYVYQVLDERIPDDKIGKEIGEVDTIPDEIGDFNGNASNRYDIGTKYYQIVGKKTSNAIAVRDGNEYLKATIEYKQTFSLSFFLKEHSELLKMIGLAIIVIILLILFRNLALKRKNKT